jgi:hypothetical protein
MRGLTEYAQTGLEELFEMRVVCGDLMRDLQRQENILVQRNKSWPDLPSVSNERFNSISGRCLGAFLLCRSVDIYNWYCLEALKLALKTDPNIINLLRRAAEKIATTITKAEKKHQNPANALTNFLENRYAGDRAIRDAVHKHLDVAQDPETELICLCRNVLVHRRGADDRGEIADAMKKLGTKRADIYPVAHPPGHMPIRVGPDGVLFVDGNVGMWACDFLHNQIHLMDQQFSHIYKLPTKRYRPRPLGRKSLGDPNAR